MTVKKIRSLTWQEMIRFLCLIIIPILAYRVIIGILGILSLDDRPFVRIFENVEETHESTIYG